MAINDDHEIIQSVPLDFPKNPLFTAVRLTFCPPLPIALSWFRGTPEVHDEIEGMKSEHEAAKLTPRVTLREIVTNAALRAPLIISVVMMLAQQLSGINAVSSTRLGLVWC